MQKFILVLTTITILIVFGSGVQPVYAATPLPASDWYAVIWNRTNDTLHWVNQATELASIPRPKLPGESDDIGLNRRLYISPNGRYMMQYATLQNQRQGIGFYDFQTGQWLQVHEAMPDEFFIHPDRNPFMWNSASVAIGLAGPTGWRVVAFDTATGNAINQFNANHPDIPAGYLPTNRVPRVTLYQLDEGLATGRVHIRFIDFGPNHQQVPQPALAWIPTTNTIEMSNFDPFLLDIDILPVEGRALYSVVNTNEPVQSQVYQQTTGHNGQMMFNFAGAFISQTRWIANGQFVAFRVSQSPYVPMWHIAGLGAATTLPFGPDYDELLGTSDGYVLVDYQSGVVQFSNTMQFEAFAPTVGNTIYTTNAPDFYIAYITPIGTQFTLTSVATPSNGGNPVVMSPDTVQSSPQTCGTAPAPRLNTGDSARVAYTDGASLNIRTAAGDYLMQIPEGTVVNVVAGPVCANNYYWWELRFQSGNVTVGGWAAEGDSESYWLERILHVSGVVIQPNSTTTPMAVAPPQPTPVPPVVQARPVTTPGDGDCTNAPVGADLTIGANAHTQTDGTLAMRTNITDAYPSYNIASNQTVNVINGPACHGGFRMWYVSTTLNGTTVQGWVADGFGNNRYLRPGPARTR